MEIGSKNIKECNASTYNTNLNKLFVVFVISSNLCKLINSFDHCLKLSLHTNIFYT